MSKPTVIIEPTEKHTASLIFLHGLGDVGQTWFDDFQYFKIPDLIPHVKYIFPTASVMKVSKNNGELMTSWFDVHGFDSTVKEDQNSIEEASTLLNSFIEEEMKNGIPAERIIIGGFSMGGAVSLHGVLTIKHKVAGVVALSTWLPLSSHFPHSAVNLDVKLKTPILQCQGTADTIIRINRSRTSAETFQSMGFENYEFKEYEGLEHTDNEDEMKDVADFIRRVLPKID